jgi:hypothetical protein
MDCYDILVPYVRMLVQGLLWASGEVLALWCLARTCRDEWQACRARYAAALFSDKHMIHRLVDLAVRDTSLPLIEELRAALKDSLSYNYVIDSVLLPRDLHRYLVGMTELSDAALRGQRWLATRLRARFSDASWTRVSPWTRALYIRNLLKGGLGDMAVDAHRTLPVDQPAWEFAYDAINAGQIVWFEYILQSKHRREGNEPGLLEALCQEQFALAEYLQTRRFALDFRQWTELWHLLRKPVAIRWLCARDDLLPRNTVNHNIPVILQQVTTRREFEKLREGLDALLSVPGVQCPTPDEMWDRGAHDCVMQFLVARLE